MNVTIFLVLFCMVLNTVAQLLLKEAMIHIGGFSFTWQNLIPISLKIVMSPYIIAGLFCYVISVGFWLLVLSRVDVGVAYPLTSIAFILTAIAAYVFLGEPLSITRMLGIVVIIAGIYLITRT